MNVISVLVFGDKIANVVIYKIDRIHNHETGGRIFPNDKRRGNETLYETFVRITEETTGLLQNEYGNVERILVIDKKWDMYNVFMTKVTNIDKIKLAVDANEIDLIQLTDETVCNIQRSLLNNEEKYIINEIRDILQKDVDKNDIKK